MTDYTLVNNPELEDAVINLLNEINQYPNVSDHPGYLGRGSNHQAFQFEYKSQPLVARIAIRSQIHPEVVKRMTQNMSRSNGIDHLEHIVASDPDRGVIISTLIPGKNICDLSKEEIEKITDQQFRDVIDTVIATVDAGITIDPKPSNLLYDPIQGFGIVDFCASPIQTTDREQEISEGIAGFGVSLTNAQYYGRRFNDTDLETLTNTIAAMEAGIDATERLKSIAREKVEPRIADRVNALLSNQVRSMETAAYDLKVQAGLKPPRAVQRDAWWDR